MHTAQHWLRCFSLLAMLIPGLLAGCSHESPDAAGVQTAGSPQPGGAADVPVSETNPVADDPGMTEAAAGSEPVGSVLRLATTTSTRDSGLLDVLVPMFEARQKCRVDVIAVGTGAALKLGESGDADAVLVHARAAEDAFMAAGHGIRHEPVMHNFFLIAGPADDPAQIKGRDAAAALVRIAEHQVKFVSRGDDSGTHKQELSLWKAAGGRPDWDGYVESGQGMGPTLLMADEMNACVLCDDATWLKMSADSRIVPLVSGTEDLKNPYAVMVVNPEKHPAINVALAQAFADFLISTDGQQAIRSCTVNGQPLFQPDRLSEGNGE